MNKEQILTALETVIDPEIGVNIVDLGLIYEVDVQDEVIKIEMTMTTPTCPLHALISKDAKDALWKKFPSAKGVEIEMVWNPPWNADMMSDNAKRILGWD